MPPIRILIIDPYPLFRDGVSRILDGEPGFSVAGSAATIAEGRQLVRELLPDVLIFEWNLPDGSGLTLLRDLERDGARARTVLLTTGIGREDMALALMAGLSGLVLKQSATPLLFKCLRSVIAGEYWLGHDRLPDLVESMRQFAGMRTSAPRESLTPRESHVTAAVVAGSRRQHESRYLVATGDVGADGQESPVPHLRQGRRLEPAGARAVRDSSPAGRAHHLVLPPSY